MSIEVTPGGYKCSLACEYCYQTPVRNAGNSMSFDYDMDAMKRALLAEGFKFTVFGGEPLVIPIDDLEELWKFGVENFGTIAAKYHERPNGVQTHGADMTDAHIALFQKYQVGVGMSVDGPDELNDARWAGSIERTREATARSIANMHKLLDNKHGVSLIVTLHRLNASAERLPRLLDWFRELSKRGLRHVNLHLLEVDNPGVREKLALTVDENVEALMSCARLQSEVTIAFKPLTDMIHLLKGEDEWNKQDNGIYSGHSSCTWNACDPYTTDAVRAVDGKGNRGNCGRTCKDGPTWAKANTPGFERYLGLAYAPMAYGGCQGCRFFAVCKGHCPGEGVNGDWRNKTEHCTTLMRVFERIEAMLIAAGETPISLSPYRHAVEQILITGWSEGRSIGLRVAVEHAKNPSAAPLPSAIQNQPHGDIPHGDHTDAQQPSITHGDHTDVTKWNTL